MVGRRMVMDIAAVDAVIWDEGLQDEKAARNQLMRASSLQSHIAHATS